MVKTDKKVDAHFLMSCQVTYNGPAYAPVTHAEVITTINQYIAADFNIRSERYLAGSNGQKAVGILNIEAQDSELGFMLAWKNSLDGSMAFKMGFGAQVFVCSNGMLQGDTGNFKKRHVGEAKEEIMDHLRFAVDQMNPVMKHQVDLKELYKQIPIDKKYASELLGRLFFEKGILSPQQASTVRKELEKASYNYGAPGTVWELYNHCTYALRDTHPTEWHDKHLAVGNFFAELFNA